MEDVDVDGDGDRAMMLCVFGVDGASVVGRLPDGCAFKSLQVEAG